MTITIITLKNKNQVYGKVQIPNPVTGKLETIGEWDLATNEDIENFTNRYNVTLADSCENSAMKIELYK